MIQEKIKKLIQDALKNLGLEIKEIFLEHPVDLRMGDYSTNVALRLGENSAQKIAEELNKNLPTEVEKVEVAGPGFINFYLNKYFFQDSIKKILDDEGFGKNQLHNNKKIMVEYTDPNPFKPFHVGHLMTNAIGESIARVLEYSGAKVFRANYQGDIGLHVAKALYGLVKKPEEYRLKNETLQNQAFFIGKAYVYGAEAYQIDPEAKKEIDEMNKKIYNRSDPELNDLYDWGFEATMEAFEEIYKILGTKFDYYFLESKMAILGEKLIRENLGKVFEESKNAIIFKAEKYEPTLHTRVFVTSEGLPTYETKELGLTEVKFEEVGDLHLSIVITGNEQKEYMKVVAKALSLIHPEHASKMLHITHGLIRFSDRKMSSRTGDVVTGETLIEEVKNKTKGNVEVAVGAIKYAILKQSTRGDIIFDLEKSISPEGDSGPYLQYSYARAKSVLVKATKENLFPNFNELPAEVTETEKLLYRFPEVVLRAAEEYEPHHIANYLIDLARAFNSYYGETKILDTKDIYSPYRLAFASAYAKVLGKGLHLLGIEAPERM
ncbi:arginine--tRNA ligase [Candidatus Nomurabacteria bacterium RIFCSPLOWO2_01_FULL_46_18]|uniref:Arginine--tRNA ligase n=1 Tax=Candidatus Nomurabacteria bacterium RIFCSPLOWO2_01_FULL_46_18 TaxID=1801783 RepID=A0A1F6XDK3_9BACT|nr:MAG: arginine--tRNA ligase [Candidatus Nomurabacteria bacterium RIFCSPLOWO2_01_FULL_46_18]